MDQSVALLVLLIALALISLIFVPRWRMQRAIRQVIKIFRDHGATNINGARNIVELGLKPRGILEGMLRGRDYKPYALSALVKSGIVLTTEDNRLYLSEDKLAQSNIKL
ncbi:MAG: hypothetical protein HYX79_00950 [Chloroflexi bacterium]|nr:hypothetical protein [Chloroflexota bacterium]